MVWASGWADVLLSSSGEEAGRGLGTGMCDARCTVTGISGI